MLLRYGLLCIRAKLGPREMTICLQDTVFTYSSSYMICLVTLETAAAVHNYQTLSMDSVPSITPKGKIPQ